MNDLWSEIGGQFSELALLLSRVLSKRDSALQIRQAFSKGTSWVEIEKAYREDVSFPKNIVQLALATDFLRVLAIAIAADGEIEQTEIQLAYSLTQPLVAVLASHGRYAQYENLAADETFGFLNEFMSDASWFGGRAIAPQ